MMRCLLLATLLLAVTGGGTLDMSAVSADVPRTERESWTDLPVSSLDEIKTFNPKCLGFSNSH